MGLPPTRVYLGLPPTLAQRRFKRTSFGILRFLTTRCRWDDGHISQLPSEAQNVTASPSPYFGITRPLASPYGSSRCDVVSLRSAEPKVSNLSSGAIFDCALAAM